MTARTGEAPDQAWKGQRVLVTGGSGFLGIRLVERLLAEGAELCLPWRDGTRLATALGRHGVDPAASGLNGRKLDLCEVDNVLKEVEAFKPTRVFHLAGMVNVATAKSDPLANWQANLQATWNVLEACRKVEGIESIVVASSDKAYGPAAQLPYTENMPLRGAAPYDCAKACTDMVARSYALNYKLKLGITRCGNFYGGGDLDVNRLVPGTILRVLQGRVPELRSDGQFTRDFLHISDAVEANVCLSDALASGKVRPGEAYNFSSECRMRVLDVVVLIMRLLGMDARPVICDGARGEIRDQYLDCSKAKAQLGWQAKLDMEAGLREAVEWYRSWWAEQSKKMA